VAQLSAACFSSENVNCTPNVTSSSNAKQSKIDIYLLFMTPIKSFLHPELSVVVWMWSIHGLEISWLPCIQHHGEPSLSATHLHRGGSQAGKERWRLDLQPKTEWKHCFKIQTAIVFQCVWHFSLNSINSFFLPCIISALHFETIIPIVISLHQIQIINFLP